VTRHDRGSAFSVAKLHVTTSLADFAEGRLCERVNRIPSGNGRKSWTRTAISTEAMIGGSPNSAQAAAHLRIELERLAKVVKRLFDAFALSR
jgi:hypothetical protein